MLIEKWCQSEQSSHLDTDRTSTENFVKSSKKFSGMCDQICVLEVPKISTQERFEAVKKNFPSGANFLKRCVNRLGLSRCPRSPARKVSRESKLSFRSEFPKGCVNRLGFL